MGCLDVFDQAREWVNRISIAFEEGKLDGDYVDALSTNDGQGNTTDGAVGGIGGDDSVNFISRGVPLGESALHEGGHAVCDRASPSGCNGEDEEDVNAFVEACQAEQL